ncbi:MAG TPA: hypothetical protein DCZ72_07090, partial [Armatimonadetes bacterium]|nr:hypothetical protein [Armatimonadota bacterium]
PAAAECAAALARASERLTQRTGLAPPTGVEIVLFPSASSYHAYHELRGSARPEWSTACTAGGRVMLYGAEADRDQLTGTLGHELTHLTVRGAADGRTVPVWLDEGLAALVGGQFAEARGVLQRTGLHLALEALHVPSFAAYEQADAYLAYATSRVLVEDLLRAGTGPLGAYLSALGAGASAEDAFVAAWGVSLADYYAAWAAALAGA